MVLQQLPTYFTSELATNQPASTAHRLGSRRAPRPKSVGLAAEARWSDDKKQPVLWVLGAGCSAAAAAGTANTSSSWGLGRWSWGAGAAAPAAPAL